MNDPMVFYTGLALAVGGLIAVCRSSHPASIYICCAISIFGQALAVGAFLAYCQ